MNHLHLNLHFPQNTIQIRPARLVYQMSEKAPRSPENFKGPEKQSEQVQLGEVASQSPSQIFNDTISAGASIKTQFVANTSLLAKLATVDPLTPSTPLPYNNAAAANQSGNSGGNSSAAA
jgi:hypothetical protein